jgi:hypothetical protein
MNGKRHWLLLVHNQSRAISMYGTLVRVNVSPMFNNKYERLIDLVHVHKTHS